MSNVPTDISYFIKDKNGKEVEKNLFDVIDDSDVWEKNGLTIIGLKGVQKLAKAVGIVEKDFSTEVQPTEGNKQQHVVNIWVGFKNDADPNNFVRGSGEASMLNTGKIVENKAKGERRYEEYACIDSQYRYAMADKRAYCRAVLKLVGLFGIYSSVESSSFSPDDIQNYDY